MEENGPVGEQLNYALAEGVLRVNEALQHTIAALWEEVALPEPLANALWQLGPDDRPLSRRELAERLHCDPSNVTFLVDRLESRRLIGRARVKSDRRIRAVALTPAGVEVRKRLIETLAESAMFTRLTRPEQRQLADLLGRCANESRDRTAVGHNPG